MNQLVKTGSLVSLFFLVLAAGLSAQGDENLYEAGRKAFADGLHVMAVRSFRQLVEQYPDSPWADDADYLRSLAHYYLGEPQACIDLLSGFARRYPRSPHAARTSYWLALAYLQRNRLRDARESLTDQIERHPDEVALLEQCLLLRGKTEETLGLWQEAKGSYRAILERSTAHRLWGETLFRLGAVELRLDNYSEALASFTRVLVEFPDAPKAEESVFYTGEAYYFLGKTAEAERRYKTALQASPSLEQRETSLYRLVRIRASAGRLTEALSTAEELEASFPGGRFAEELEALKADLYFDLQRYEEAYAQYHRVLERPHEPQEQQVLLFNLGLSALLGGNPQAAIEPLGRALEGPNGDIAEESTLRLGIALSDLRRDGEAIQTLEAFRDRYPASENNREGLELLGALYARNGRHSKAVEIYTRLLALYPFDEHRDELIFRRGVSLLSAGEESKALDNFFAVLELPSSSFRGESLYNIGFIYSRRGEFSRARGFFEQLLGQSPPEELKGRAILAAGTSAFNAGDFDGALKWFQRNTTSAGESLWSGDSWLYLGRTYYRLDRLQEAAGAFSTAARLLDGTAKGEESLFWEGLALFRLDDLEKARRAFRRLTERYPEGRRIAEAYYRSGMCAVQTGSYEESIEEFDRARARLGSRSEEYTRSLEQEILYQRAFSLLKSGRRDGAAAGFRELAELYPQGSLAAEGLFALAQEEFRSERYRSALRAFVEVLERFPNRQDALSALYWAGVSAVRAEQPEQGLEFLLRYLETSPAGGLARVAVDEIRTVLASLTGEEREKVLVEFYRRTESSKSLAEELKNQVRYEYAVFLFSRDRHGALQLLQTIRASAPPEPLASQVNLLVGEYYRLAGELSRALDIFRGITSSSTQLSAASAQLAVAWILEAKARAGDGSLDAAADEYLKVYFLYPDFQVQAQEGLYQAGRVFWEQGKRDRASRLFEKLAAEFPESPWLAELPEP